MSDLAQTLARPRGELSWLRDQLIKEGDIFAPRYGQIAMAVPLFTSFVLSRYPRDRAGNEMLTLDQMRGNASPSSKSGAVGRAGKTPRSRSQDSAGQHTNPDGPN